jgi:hypothetical protein
MKQVADVLVIIQFKLLNYYIMKTISKIGTTLGLLIVVFGGLLPFPYNILLYGVLGIIGIIYGLYVIIGIIWEPLYKPLLDIDLVSTIMYHNKTEFRIIPTHGGKFSIEMSTITGWKKFIIHDIHVGHGGDEIHPMQASIDDCRKVLRMLNLLNVRGIKITPDIHWKVMDRVRKSLNIEYTYLT